MIGVIPVRSFTGAKRRLAESLGSEQTARLMRALASRVADAIVPVVDRLVVVSSDPDVVEWAAARHIDTHSDPGSLNDAALLAPQLAGRDESWLVCHADLPLLSSVDVQAMHDAIKASGTAIAPSLDGGTNLIGGHGSMAFSYGPGSYHRHLGSRPRAKVVIRPGTAIDVDSVRTLDAVLGLPSAEWLTVHVGRAA